MTDKNNKKTVINLLAEPKVEQVAELRTKKVIFDLAKKAGIDDNLFAASDTSVIRFFESIVEECAKVAEKQSRSYTGEGSEHVGCYGAATAIRTFGKLTDNYEN